MKRFFKIVLTIAVIAFICYGVSYFILPVNSIKLEEYTHEVAVICNDAYIVRDETVYYATCAGTVYNTAAEGERVSNNQSIADIYGGEDISTYLKQLDTIDRKVKRLTQQSIGSEVYQIDELSQEGEISSKMNEIISLSKTDSVQEIHEARTLINGYRSGNVISTSDKLWELDRERIEIEAKLGSKSDVVSTSSGIFSSYVDGLEAVLSPDNIEQYTPEYIRSLAETPDGARNGKKVAIGDKLCKVMNNHEWYVIAVIDNEYRTLCKENTSVSLKFPDIAADKAEGTVRYISDPDENNECIVLIRVPSYTELAFAYRHANVDIVLESYSGYKIPSYAIHTGSGMNSYYVYAMKGSKTYKCECEVVYNDPAGEYAVIRSVDGTENSLAAMDRLVVGER